jgi:hypothetical protein
VAPESPVAMLMAMQAPDSDVRARCFTNDKPINEATAELSNVGSTGYVALSENVLSGHYYLVFQAGTSSSVAWVGSSRRLVTGDEAFDRAEEEVGIYEVHDVGLEVVDIPGTSAAETSAASGSDEADPPGPPSRTSRYPDGTRVPTDAG